MMKRIKAIPSTTDARGSNYLVMVSHAGKSARTGAKVHLAVLTIWTNGNTTISPCNCSNNGRLRGSLITADNYDFSHVSCKNCNATPEAAARRNACAIDLEVSL